MSMRSHIAFGRQAEHWGVQLPPACREAAETWQAANSLVTTSPVDVLRSAASSGTLTPANVQQELERLALAQVASQAARELVAELDYPLGRRFALAVAEHADDITAHLAGHFAKHGQRLADAAAVLPADIEAEQVLAMGTDAQAAWHDLASARAALDSIAHVHIDLVRDYLGAIDSPGVTAYVAGPLSVADLQRARSLWRGIGDGGVRLPEARGGVWEHLTRAGYRLTINSVDEADALTAATVAA